MLFLTVNINVGEYKHSVELEKGGFYIYKLERNVGHEIYLKSTDDLQIYLLGKNMEVLYYEKANIFRKTIYPKENILLYLFNNDSKVNLTVYDNMYKKVNFRYVGILSIFLSALVLILRRKKIVKS